MKLLIGIAVIAAFIWVLHLPALVWLGVIVVLLIK